MNKEEILKDFRNRFTVESKDSEDIWLKSSNGQIFQDPYMFSELEIWLNEHIK